MYNKHNFQYKALRMSINKIIIACLLMTVSAQTTVKNSTNNNMDSIGFPEMEENPNLINKDNRVPVYLPSMCPLNELYYPGDQKDDWICDCRPAYIYHPKSDSCWPAFQRGPCSQGQHLILPQNSVIPVCEMNPCVVDGYVTWNGKCERLGAINPCAHLFPIASALGVNATTLLVGCVRLNLESRFGDLQPEPTTSCRPGCRRSVNGKCVPISF